MRSCFLRPLISGMVLGFGGFHELGHGHAPELGDMDVAVARIVFGDRGADAADAFGGLVELFGQRQRFFAIELGQEFAVDLDIAIAVGRASAAMKRTRAIVPRVAVC